MTTVLILGDVHGDYTKLQNYAHIINKVDKTIFVGDLIDRGPKPLEVMEYVLKLDNTIILEGNHEFKYRKKIKAGKVSYPGEITQEQFPLFKDLLDKFYTLKKVYYKDDYIGVSHAPAALYQHEWDKIPFDKYLYAWTDGKDENGLPRRLTLKEKYVNQVSEKPVIYGHTHYKKLEVAENEYCVDYDCGYENGQLCGVIFEDGKLKDSFLY